jgi:hypothetical protein
MVSRNVTMLVCLLLFPELKLHVHMLNLIVNCQFLFTFQYNNETSFLFSHLCPGVLTNLFNARKGCQQKLCSCVDRSYCVV